MFECSLHRDASSPEEYQLVEGYAEGVQDVVQGYQAKVAGLGQSTKTRHPGGRGGVKRGGKVRSLALPPDAHLPLIWGPSACASGQIAAHPLQQGSTLNSGGRMASISCGM